ncbi:MAG: 50S ribosomal protein L10 [Candidatus Gracilibacteria bacterium]|nr:50S ribosomal protein L10 [Candidatus Gracilibacteria bacterium]
MAVTKARKSEILSTLEAHIKEAQAIAFTSNQKLTVLDVSKIKTELRKENAVYMVAKKTLICLAMKNVLGAEIDINTLPGAVAILIAKGDKVAPLGIVNKFAYELRKEEKIKFVGGYIDGRVLGAAETAKLASLPSREVLLAKLLGSMMSPLSALARFFDGAKTEMEAKNVTSVGDLAKAMAAAAPAVAAVVEAPAVEVAPEAAAPEAPAAE